MMGTGKSLFGYDLEGQASSYVALKKAQLPWNFSELYFLMAQAPVSNKVNYVLSNNL